MGIGTLWRALRVALCVLGVGAAISQTVFSQEGSATAGGLPAMVLETSPIEVIAENGHKIEVRNEITIIQIDSAADLELATKWAKAQLQEVRKKNPKARTEVLVFGQANEAQKTEYATNLKTFEMAQALGWGNAAGLQSFQDIRETGTQAEKLSWGELEGMGRSIAGDTPFLVGRVPKKSNFKKWTMVTIRGAAVAGVVTWSTMIKDQAILDQALVPGLLAGAGSGTLMALNEKLMAWLEGKGWLKPSDTVKGGFAEGQVKIGMVSLVFYSTVGVFRYFAGLVSTVAAPFLGTLESMIFENPGWLAMAEISRTAQKTKPWQREKHINRANWAGLGYSALMTLLVVSQMANAASGKGKVYFNAGIDFTLERIAMGTVGLTGYGVILKYRWQIMKDSLQNILKVLTNRFSGAEARQAFEDIEALNRKGEHEEEASSAKVARELERSGGGMSCQGAMALAFGS